MKKQPKAMLLAELLEASGIIEPADELRRLHAENQALNDALKYSMSCHQEMSSLAIRQRARLDELEQTKSVPGTMPEIVERVLQSAGKTRRETHNPCITANECIKLANWIVANTNQHPRLEPLAAEKIEEIWRENSYGYSYDLNMSEGGFFDAVREVEAAYGIK